MTKNGNGKAITMGTLALLAAIVAGAIGVSYNLESRVKAEVRDRVQVHEGRGLERAHPGIGRLVKQLQEVNTRLTAIELNQTLLLGRVDSWPEGWLKLPKSKRRPRWKR
jgi:hypothetical protein